jgi:hypothetical protein
MRSRFTVVDSMKIRTLDVVTNILCSLVMEHLVWTGSSQVVVLCVSTNCYGMSIVWCRYFFVWLPVVVGIMDCIVDMHNHYKGFTM